MVWLHLTTGKEPWKTAYVPWESLGINYKSMPSCMAQVSMVLTFGSEGMGRK